MRLLSSALTSALAGVVIAGCDESTDPDAGVDAAARIDGGGVDASLVDASLVDGGSVDGGSVDGGRRDAGSGSDGGGAGDAGPICGDLGKPCTSASDCGGGYTCGGEPSACLPPGSGRPDCGGFAGAECPTTGAYTVCRYFARSDYGPCLTTEEAVCACAGRARPYFDCP